MVCGITIPKCFAMVHSNSKSNCVFNNVTLIRLQIVMRRCVLLFFKQFFQGFCFFAEFFHFIFQRVVHSLSFFSVLPILPSSQLSQFPELKSFFEDFLRQSKVHLKCQINHLDRHIVQTSLTQETTLREANNSGKNHLRLIEPCKVLVIVRKA